MRVPRIYRTRGPVWCTALLVVLALGACGEAPSDEHVIDEPVTIEEIEGSEVAHVTLTAAAERRLDITTGSVRRTSIGTAVPLPAVIVDPHGQSWVYTNPEPHAFVRAPITIDYEEEDRAHLIAGPPVGTRVVTLGAAELYGAELGIGH
jgi:hypothetical protein